jgi:ABC-2 type transport system ATP-binding protein
MEAVVEAVEASKTYGKTQALRTTTLRIAQGEVVALLGPNGAGKTTFVSLMLGLRKPTTGSVRLFGLDPRDRRARSRTGVMLQESGVPQFLKVREIIDLFRSYFPRPLDRDAIVNTAGLADKSNDLVVTLSGGQQQRLYFALAMCGDPQALFLDEPTVGMDVEARRNFWVHLRGFARSKRTVLLTTHYLEEADAIADRIVVIEKGIVVADASPSVLKARVENKRVTFDAAAPPDLTGLPVHRVESTGSRISVLTAQPEAVLQALFARGVQIRNLEVVGATLEEAVMGLTVREGPVS